MVVVIGLSCTIHSVLWCVNDEHLKKSKDPITSKKTDLPTVGTLNKTQMWEYNKNFRLGSINLE